MITQYEIKISVRDLVEFVLRSGNLDNRFTGSSRALEGSRIHRKIQKESGEEYTAEVTLKYSLDYRGLQIVIEGRADGIIIQDGTVIVDEIKTTTLPLEVLDEHSNLLHWAQAKCYAFFYAQQQQLSTISVRLTYYQLDTEEIKYQVEEYTLADLEQFFHNMLEQFYLWARRNYDWNIIRNNSIKALTFPFANYRDGQRKLVVAVYKTIAAEKKLFVQAPTGIGKTISTLFPSVKALGEGLTSKIFYLTAKTSTRSVAEEAFSIMRQKGLKLKTVTLTAKEKICFMEKSNCTPEHCEYAKGHFDRVNEALFQIINNEDALTKEIIMQYAKEFRICPFEFSLDLTLWADCVICDYNYLFDPRVYLKRFFTNKGADYTFLIDETHNLADRAREMFSAELYKKPFLKLKKSVKERNAKLSKVSGKINAFMLSMKKLCGDEKYYISVEEQKEIYPLLRKFTGECEEFLLKNETDAVHEEMLEIYFSALAYLRISELYSEHYITYVEKTADDISIKLFCRDPSNLLKEALLRGKTAVFFSATFMPMDYYHDILGGSAEDFVMRLHSPFDTQNRSLLIASDISTRYRDREGSYLSIADYIKKVISCRRGNYMIFFPSYQYMHNVYDAYIKEYPNGNTHMQLPSMTEEERTAFLELFQPDPHQTTIGFCVLGGVYSEGIDLKNDRLIGVVIVGVGLPQICLERDIIRDYFQQKNGLGYEYAYVYPGMNKVLQAAGRVIRSESDRGIILLIDERFAYASYKKLFPAEWFPNIQVNNMNIAKYLNEFWKDE